jgi:hypothetical protein
MSTFVCGDFLANSPLDGYRYREVNVGNDFVWIDAMPKDVTLATVRLPYLIGGLLALTMLSPVLAVIVAGYIAVKASNRLDHLALFSLVIALVLSTRYISLINAQTAVDISLTGGDKMRIILAFVTLFFGQYVGAVLLWTGRKNVTKVNALSDAAEPIATALFGMVFFIGSSYVAHQQFQAIKSLAALL